MLNSFKQYVDGISQVTDEQFDIVKSYLTPVKVSKGKIMLKQGEVANHVYFVVKGCLRSYIQDEDKKVHVLEFAPENWWLGDNLSLYKQSPSIFYIDAVEDSELLFAGMDFFTRMPQLFSEFHMLYITSMHERVQSIQQRLQYLLGSKGPERYLNFISTYPDLSVRLPQHMIASYLGISPESLSRIRNKLSNRP